LALQKQGGVTFRESIFNAVATTLEYTTYRFARHSAVVAISERVANDLIRFYHCPAPIHVIHHGVDLEQFSPANRQLRRSEVRGRYGIAEDEVLFLYVGDLRKGAERCIEALSRLDRGHLLFVSRSSPADYQRLAEEAGLGSRVLFQGPTNQVERFYAAADALLLPTPYDAFAMVVTEAMACGLPIVVSREAGVSELIRHGTNGLLLENVGSGPELAGLMQSLLEDPGLRLALGREARKTVESMSWDSVADQTLKVYRELLENSN
jgi:UDP-glucose:(heptosyl)LPS alpha-1,3-glucosyltransferase